MNTMLCAAHACVSRRAPIHFGTVTLSKSIAVAAVVICARTAATAAQAPGVAKSAVQFVDVGSERERVLRVLQVIGEVPFYPWSLRQLSPAESDRLLSKAVAHAALLPAEPNVHTVGALRIAALPMDIRTIYNSAFPYGYNDGPVWAGRGVTASVSAGVSGRIGPLSFQLEPLLFDAQNAQFPLHSTSVPENIFGDPFYSDAIDLPQRFGNGAYRRLDPGQSSARLDLGPIAAELSTANQWWGPTLVQPLVLGNNAPGFLHATLGTSNPVNIGIGQAHARMVWGRLEQSEFSNEHSGDSLRFMSGIVGSFTPRGVPGLELGATRFFHSRWPSNGLSNARFLRPLQGLLKSGLATPTNPSGDDPGDNQLASVFFRWVFPKAAFELYGEYGREDHNVDIRDVYQEPDHDAGYTIGLQRVWSSPRGTIVFRGELLDTRLSPLYQGRLEQPWYLHAPNLANGHTELGQILGAPAAYGGGGAVVGVDVLTATGRWTVQWDRQMRAEARNAERAPTPLLSDVMHSLGVERVYTLGKRTVSGGLRGVWDLNRNFGADRFNLNATIGMQEHW